MTRPWFPFNKVSEGTGGHCVSSHRVLQDTGDQTIVSCQQGFRGNWWPLFSFKQGFTRSWWASFLFKQVSKVTCGLCFPPVVLESNLVTRPAFLFNAISGGTAGHCFASNRHWKRAATHHFLQPGFRGNWGSLVSSRSA